MKFTVHVDGADQGLVERLTAAANRKLAPKLKRIAARRATAGHAAVAYTGRAATSQLGSGRAFGDGAISGSPAGTDADDTAAADPSMASDPTEMNFVDDTTFADIPSDFDLL